MISNNRRISRRDTPNVRRVETYQGPPGPNIIIGGGGQTMHPSSHSAPNPFTIRSKSLIIDPDQPQSATPINTLPSELICEIFARFVALEDPPSIDSDGPMLLIQVCRHWRALACNLPSLWSSFSTGRRDCYPRVALVEQWLARAGPNTPLTLRLECPVFTGHNRGVALMDLFLAHAHRWREVSLELDEILANRFECLQRGGAPMLEAAHLKISISSRAQSARRVFELLQSCKRFTRLSLAYEGCSGMLSAIPWETLTWIHLKWNIGINIDIWISLLSRCRGVVDLSLGGLGMCLTDTPIPESPPVLLHLRNITIDSRCDAGHLLLYFALPALENLTLAVAFPATLEHDLDTLLRRSPLTKLTLLSRLLEEETILACLSHDSFNSVHELSLPSTYVGDDVVRALTFSDKPGVEFLRGLENLTLGRYVGTRESFVQMVTSRCRPGKSGLARLKAVTVLEKGREDSEDLGYLAEQIILQQSMLP